jgi:hypothetical protein
MQKLTTLLFGAFIASFSQAQYCTAVGPSSTIDSNVGSVALTGVVGSINYTAGCPGVVGLQDLTFLGTTLNAGSPYTAYIQFSTCGGNFNGAGSAWIDFDQNGAFDANEVIGSWAGTPPTSLSSFNFTVPTGAQNGTTRMRVTQQEQGILPLNPCAAFTWGSVMDFSITIGNGIDCSGYLGDETTDALPITSLPYTDTRNNSYCYSSQNLVYNSPDIYYQFNPSPMMQSVNVSLCGSSFDTFLSVVDATGNIIAFNDDEESCGTSSELTFNTNGLGLCYIIVEGWGNETGEYTLNVDANYLGQTQLDNEHIVVSPNPASESISITGFEGKVDVLDVSGKKILSVADFKGEKIQVEKLESGLYTIVFTKDGKQFSKKIMIN